MDNHTPAAFALKAFNCLYCGVYARQYWHKIAISAAPHHSTHAEAQQVTDVCTCEHCSKFSIWVNGKLVVPDVGTAPMPHPDMPKDVAVDFEEARGVLAKSPRSSAALLRLALQKLCAELGGGGKNINEDIAILVANGLPVQVQQALDIIRVVGNEQVHPGQLDVRDDPSIAAELFALINFIVEDRITRPKTIGALYARLPEDKRVAIERRDKSGATAALPLRADVATPEVEPIA